MPRCSTCTTISSPMCIFIACPENTSLLHKSWHNHKCNGENGTAVISDAILSIWLVDKTCTKNYAFFSFTFSNLRLLRGFLSPIFFVKQTYETYLFAHGVLLTIDDKASSILCCSQLMQKLKSLGNSYFRDSLAHMLRLKTEFLKSWKESQTRKDAGDSGLVTHAWATNLKLMNKNLLQNFSHAESLNRIP